MLPSPVTSAFNSTCVSTSSASPAPAPIPAAFAVKVMMPPSMSLTVLFPGRLPSVIDPSRALNVTSPNPAVMLPTTIDRFAVRVTKSSLVVTDVAVMSEPTSVVASVRLPSTKTLFRSTLSCSRT